MRLRRTSRLLVLDERDRVLLLQVEDTSVLDPAAPRRSPIFWVTPGGSLNSGETHEAAARRELWEETGIDSVPLGPWVWTQDHVLDWQGELIRLHERFYVVRLASTSINLDNMEDLERSVYRAHRWWEVEAIRASDELFYPTGLGELLTPIVAGQLPDHPLPIA